MTKELTRFDFEGKSIRTFGTKLEPWFAAVDVLRALGIPKNYIKRTLNTLDEDEKMVVKLMTEADSSVIKLMTEEEKVKGNHNMVWIISEPGFYKIALRARTDAAKAFTRWVTHEVLPSIRKRGYYLDPRWGVAPTDDGKWVLASGERLSAEQVRMKAARMGIEYRPINETKEIVREINQREHYLAIREKYPYSYDEVDRDYGDVEYYRCFIKENEDRSKYSVLDWTDEYFSEAFIELIKRVDEEESMTDATHQEERSKM